MGLGKSSIDYIPYVHEISQRMKGVTMEKIIPLLFISSLDQGRYPVVKRQYLAVNPALVNCNLLEPRGLLSSKETRQKPMGLTSSTTPTTVNCVSYVQAKPPLKGFP